MNYSFFSNSFKLWAWLRPVMVLGGFAACLPAGNNYLVHNLVSDLPGVADRVDSNLINPWDFLAPFGCASESCPGGYTPIYPATVFDNGSATISLYQTNPGAIESPLASNGLLTGITGTMEGVIKNGTTYGWLLCTDDGRIVGMTPFPAVSHTLLDNSASGAIYKGCTAWGLIAGSGGVPVPIGYGANFYSATIDVWDGQLNPIQSTAAFTNPMIPSGFAPFNIQILNGRIYVAYAKQDSTRSKDVPDPGNGYVAIFDLSGNLLCNLISQGPLNSPWGIAIAPATFGDFANALLVGNSGDGKVNAFDPLTGAWKGTLDDPQGNPIVLPGLRALHFGRGGTSGDPSMLYFTADTPGPNGEPMGSHGLFGSIEAAPFFRPEGVVNAANASAIIAPNTWVSIMGGSLSATTRSWNGNDFTNQDLPTELDGVGVTVNGRPVAINYISPTQVNFLMPPDLAAGPVEIRTTNGGLTSTAISATLSNAAPAFFLASPEFKLSQCIDGNFIAALPANTPPATGVLPGETVALFATGFGATTQTAPNGQLLSTPLPVVQLPQVSMGGVTAPVSFAGTLPDQRHSSNGRHAVSVLRGSGIGIHSGCGLGSLRLHSVRLGRYPRLRPLTTARCAGEFGRSPQILKERLFRNHGSGPLEVPNRNRTSLPPFVKGLYVGAKCLINDHKASGFTVVSSSALVR
jgi:uncharacterized protein (TIGR03118 family)